MIGLDYVGVGALVTSCGTIIIGIIVALRQTAPARQIDEVHAAVSTSNGETLAGTVEKIDRQTEAIVATVDPSK